MIKKLLNNFRGCDRPTQALIIFLLAIVIMNIMNRMKEKLSDDKTKVLNSLREELKILERRKETRNPRNIDRKIIAKKKQIANAESAREAGTA
jgi:hypothetical protein